MACGRCKDEGELGPRGWCAGCEREYDTWVRRYASDIVWSVLGGMGVLLVVAMGLPLLGAGSLIAVGGVFAGFGTLVGGHRLKQQRRRKQFLVASLPRAYLPGKS